MLLLKWNITLQGITRDKSIFTICVVKYDMLLHDMMEFFCLMSDGLVKTGTRKLIKHITEHSGSSTRFYRTNNSEKQNRHTSFGQAWSSSNIFSGFKLSTENLLTHEIRCKQSCNTSIVTSSRVMNSCKHARVLLTSDPRKETVNSPVLCQASDGGVFPTINTNTF